MGKATYQLNKPFQFMKKGYSDSLSLVAAFIEHWDVAISVFRRGDMLNFWTEYVSGGVTEASAFFQKAYDDMWQNPEKEDILFQKVIQHIEPDLGGIPLIPAGESTARIYTFEEVADWMENLLKDMLGNNYWTDEKFPQGKPESYDEAIYNQLWLDAAIKEGVFSTYHPGLKTLKQSYIKAGDDWDKILQCKKIMARLRKQAYFTFDGDLYTSLRVFFDYKSQGKKLPDYYRFLGILLQSPDSLSELEEWSEKAPKEEGEAFRKLKAAWDNVHRIMAEEQGANWYEAPQLSPTELGCLLELTPSFDKGTQKANEELLEWGISDAKKVLADTQPQWESLQARKDLYTVSVGDKELYSFDGLSVVEKQLSQSTELIQACEEQIKACERLLSVVKKQDYAAFINQAAEGMERRMLFRFAIWPTVTMEEDYIESFFEAWEQFLQQKAKEGNASDELKSDIKECFLALCKLVQTWGKKDFDDKRKVAGMPISHYYIQKLDRIGKCSESFMDSDTWAEQQQKLCVIYGDLAGGHLKDTYASLLGRSNKLIGMHSDLAVDDAYIWDKRFAGLDKDAYEKWENVRKEYKAVIDSFWDFVIKQKKNLDTLVNNTIAEGPEPWGAIVENKDKQVKKVKEDLDSWERHYETNKEELLKAKTKYEEFFNPLKAAWNKEEEKRKKLEAEAKEKREKAEALEREKQKKEQERLARIRAQETEKAKKKNAKSLKRIKKRDAAKARKRKVIATLKNILLFPLKVLLFPFAVFKYSAFWGLVTIAAYVGVISFVCRYATPTYYGTDFYLGNKMGYSHYKVAEGVRVIKEGTFEGAKRMKTVELPDSLTDIHSRAFADCTSLEEIELNVVTVGNQAFIRCKSLKKVIFTGSRITLDGSVFEHCVSLTDIQTTAPVAD